MMSNDLLHEVIKIATLMYEITNHHMYVTYDDYDSKRLQIAILTYKIVLLKYL